jgi:REP element-mobilizing transposase RayT
MGNRLHLFSIDEYYHCYNRGVDKRIVFNDAQDFNYFIKSLTVYNSHLSLGKLRLYSSLPPKDGLVDVVAYCLLPNHFHLILKERSEKGISNFMKKVGTGYSMYFNKKYKRSGALFQGVFKSKFIKSDQDLRQLIAYVSNNNIVHDIADVKKYRSMLNKDLSIVRGFTSNKNNDKNMKEIVQIIKELRQSFD